MPGIGAIEVAIVLIILVVGISASVREYAKYVNNMTNQAAADHLQTLTNAALEYKKDHLGTLSTNAATQPPPYIVSVSETDLKNGDYIPNSFSLKNPFGKKYLVLYTGSATKIGRAQV